MPMTRNYTTLLLYILLSILLLVLPLSNVAYAQSTTPGGPGPLEGFVDRIEDAIDDFQEKIMDAFDELCTTSIAMVPGQVLFCPIGSEAGTLLRVSWIH